MRQAVGTWRLPGDSGLMHVAVRHRPCTRAMHVKIVPPTGGFDAVMLVLWRFHRDGMIRHSGQVLAMLKQIEQASVVHCECNAVMPVLLQTVFQVHHCSKQAPWRV